MIINRIKFYDAYRSAFGRIRYTSTVNSINTMLSNLETHSNLLNQERLLEQCAYIAATVHHETGTRYSAFKERRQVVAITARQKEVKRLQDRYWYTGYYGRGPVQLTWERNYRWAEKVTGQPLLSNPDLLLTDLDLGYEVTIKGMASGAYTGKSLNHYINARSVDFVNARRIVNGTDKAQQIANYAEKFLHIFKQSLEG